MGYVKKLIIVLSVAMIIAFGLFSLKRLKEIACPSDVYDRRFLQVFTLRVGTQQQRGTFGLDTHYRIPWWGVSECAPRCDVTARKGQHPF